jgi:hypothetical protein
MKEAAKKERERKEGERGKGKKGKWQRKRLTAVFVLFSGRFILFPPLSLAFFL